MIAGYKLKINGGALSDHIIDVGNVFTYEITGLTTGVEYGVQIASYDEDGVDSVYSAPVYETPVGPSILVDTGGNVLLDGDGNALIVF